MRKEEHLRGLETRSARRRVGGAAVRSALHSHLSVRTKSRRQAQPLFIGSEEVETPPPQPAATAGGEDGGVQLERIPSLVRGDSALEPLDPSRVPPPAMPR